MPKPPHNSLLCPVTKQHLAWCLSPFIKIVSPFFRIMAIETGKNSAETLTCLAMQHLPNLHLMLSVHGALISIMPCFITFELSHKVSAMCCVLIQEKGQPKDATGLCTFPSKLPHHKSLHTTPSRSAGWRPSRRSMLLTASKEESILANLSSSCIIGCIPTLRSEVAFHLFLGKAQVILLCIPLHESHEPGTAE